jgi:23S rRNA (cytosine1962-C5)-methyltransferase
MKFLRLSDPLLSVLFEDEDIIAIDKPYGFNAHTNDSKIQHSEFIQDGLIEIYEKQLGRKLHIIHRLDQTTTGVMIFGKSVDSAKKYAEYFFNRQVKKTYLFVTKEKSKKTSFFINLKIVHKAKDLEATTDLKFLKKSAHFELWQANPHTGRNHQIRIHAKAAEISILGDEKYGGSEFPFLCLHNQRIEFPNGIVILARPPIYFEELSLLEDVALAKLLFEADRRQRFFSNADIRQCFRLVKADFAIDQMGSTLVLYWPKERWGAEEVKRFTTFAQLMKKAMLVKFLAKGKFAENPGALFLNPQTDSNEPQTSWVAAENKMQYILRSQTGSTVGLSANQRLQRNWVLQNSEKKSILNLFSNTSNYSLAAGLGLALQVTSVDSSKNSLNGCRENFELNHLNLENAKFLLRDSLTYVEQCRDKNIKFDLIICEAPSFFRREKGVFKIESDLEKLIEACLFCLSAKGELLLSINFDELFIDDIRQVIFKAQTKLRTQNLEINCILPALDFELPEQKTQLKSFLIRLL